MHSGYRPCNRLLDTLVPEQLIQQYCVVRPAADGFRRRPYAPVQTGDSLRRVEITAVEPHGNRCCLSAKNCGFDRLDWRHHEDCDWHNRGDVNEVACRINHRDLLCWFDLPCASPKCASRRSARIPRFLTTRKFCLTRVRKTHFEKPHTSEEQDHGRCCQ